MSLVGMSWPWLGIGRKLFGICPNKPLFSSKTDFFWALQIFSPLHAQSRHKFQDSFTFLFEFLEKHVRINDTINS